MCLKNYRLIVLFCLFYFICAKSASDGWCNRKVTTQKTRTVFGQTYTHTTTMVVRECCVGYRRHGSKCVSNCETICPSNSVCKFPDFCVCRENYTQISVSNLPDRIRCQPPCGVACPAHSKCLGSRCVCVLGYKMQRGQCQAICEPHCPINSYCKSPGNCVCYAGYIKSSIINSSSRCKPQCQNECPRYSICSAPDHCACYDGYEMNELETECNLKCSPSCPRQSLCLRPNECRCDEGYRLHQEPGVNLYCEPVCAQNCSSHGKCVAPNECKCLPGYGMQHEFLDQQLCEPICSLGCEHGHCFAPEMCVCDPGYSIGSGKICSPVCEPDCVNANCTAPDTCHCWDKYSTSEKAHICMLKCSGYIFGMCFPAGILDSYKIKLIGLVSAASVISIITAYFCVLCRRPNTVDLVDDDTFIIQFRHQLEQEIIAQPI